MCEHGEGNDEERPQSRGLSGTVPAATQPKDDHACDRKESERKEKQSESGCDEHVYMFAFQWQVTKKDKGLAVVTIYVEGETSNETLTPAVK